MSATNIAAAFARWQMLFRATYPGDIPLHVVDEQSRLERLLIDERADSIADTLAKVRLLLTREEFKCGAPMWLGDMRASIAADLERLAKIDAGDEGLIAICAAAMALKDKLDGHKHSLSDCETEKEWKRLWEMDRRIEKTPAVSTVGLSAKLQFANSYADDITIGERIWRSAAADAERLVGKGGAG
jgi:hypothetical protein